MKLSIGIATALTVGLTLVAVPATSAQAATAHTAAQTAAARNNPRGEKVVSLARSRHGKPYRYGASGPNAFDCSGLTRWVYRKVGVKLPHSSSAQVKDTYRVKNYKR
ncbi:MAG: C40 family peptidase, partial [Nocardioides sp.]|nr:C40 family peptidase [Nocardioides sp.]